MRRLCKGLRTGLVAGTTLALAACAGGNGVGVGGIPGGNGALGAKDIGLIIPLTGRNSPIGQRMRDAAKLALSAPGSAVLDVHDSNMPGGVAQAANDALSRGDAILLGPLTTADTEIVAPLAVQAGKPVLAFTSDSTQARAGVWVMGLTPEQQVRRMVDAARATGRKNFAAFLPETAFGHAMAAGLQRSCSDAGLDAPKIVFHAMDEQSIQDGMKTLSDIANRQPPVPVSDPTPASDAGDTGPSAVDPTAAGSSDTASTPAPATPAQPAVVPPPSFDALVLADTGVELGHVIAAMKEDHVESGQVQIMGPALWKALDGKLGAIHGAWYAAPDARDRAGYVTQYRGMYHQAPSPMTDFAYDAAALAGSMMRQGGPSEQALTRADGYSGVNGTFHLRPDGHVTRSLAIFQIQRGGGARIIVPASRDVAIRRPS